MKKHRPTTPSQRQLLSISYRDFLSGEKGPSKKLTRGRKRSVGRNNAGRITVRHKGGGHKRLDRLVDFDYRKKNVPARVETIEYDPGRSAFIALVCYADGERRYVLAPLGLKKGDTFVVSENAPLELGNRTVLKNIPTGTFIYNVEIHPGAGARLGRSAGNGIEVVANADGFSHLKLPSGEIRKVAENGWASIGRVSNEEHKLRNYGKAGRMRWRGIRPTVRGSAMNPVDHPHGGGEGRQGIGLRRVKNIYGKAVGGIKTRKPKKYSNVFIVARRKNARDKRR
ncbi:MAG: 50S ribosomal protein L2 [Parcubacteria group bacterium]|nr:50S ribosomal protein L2 [Parcubacteria group bacterium]MBI2049086.1 50S ribosomal protein L2 [Parcubacteria group bacterium]